jgi:hypothetical protein
VFPWGVRETARETHEAESARTRAALVTDLRELRDLVVSANPETADLIDRLLVRLTLQGASGAKGR